MRGSEMVIGRVLGIEIRASRSWVLMFALVTILGAFHYNEVFATWRTESTILAAFVTSLLLFGSVLLHELAHCIAARLFDIKARWVSLSFFGGMSSLSREASRPIEELIIAGAGPVTNAAIAGILLLVSAAADSESPVAIVAAFIGWLNLTLAIFNMAPGLPLDGGRVLRAATWAVTGSFELGTKVAAAGGVALAALLLMIGLALVFAGLPIGLSLGLVGLYLYGRARMSRFEMTLRRALDGLTVGSMWLRSLPQVPRNMTLERFAEEIAPGLDGTEDPHFMVVDDGVIWGVVAASSLAKIDAGLWSISKLGDVMIPIERLEKLSMETEIVRALELMDSSEIGELPVVENNAIQGFVGRDALARFVSSRVGAATP